MKRNVKIIGSGSYLPKRIVSSDELDEMLNMPLGSCYKLSGVKNRYWVSDETVSEMAIMALATKIELEDGVERGVEDIIKEITEAILSGDEDRFL